jgi:two-component system sensor histidine kinase PhoQ
VLLAASAVLSSFFGLAGVTLDRTYKQRAEAALVERLEGHIYALIAAAGVDDKGYLTLPVEMPDTRFSSSTSGLFAQVASNDRDWQWRSVSMQGMLIDFPQNLSRTETQVRQIRGPRDRELYVFSYGVVWSDAPDPSQAYTFSVAQDMTAFNADIAAFRRSLWGSLGGVALLLLAVQGTILRWGLSPLKHAATELSAIEAGEQARLKGKYPPELRGLTGNINALLSHQQEHLERYRKSLGDLAHSLKTPLAVLQSAVENRLGEEDLSTVVKEQVERMNQITGYQLQRAATSGWTVLAAPVLVHEVVDKVLSGLRKVYADKGINATFDVAKQVEFHGDEGDLLEIIGNLVDNAFKWSRQQVRVVAESKSMAQGQSDLLIRVEDDGPGVAPEMVRYVMQRGRRADTDIAGHGIGLSIVRDIVQLYGGTLEISSSEWGGALVSVWLPARPAGNQSAH